MATGRRRGRAIFYIAFILILILVLVVVVVRFNPLAPQDGKQAVSNAAVTLEPTKDTIDIVMTTQNVQRGQVLDEGLLALVAIPRENFTEEVFFTKKELLIGTRAKMDLRAHTPLTKALIFSTTESGSVPSFEIPAGKVAISVPISKLSSVAYGLQKGDHVNVIASILMVDMDTNFQSRLPNRTGVVVAPGPIDDNQTYVTALLQSPEEYKVNDVDAFSYLGRIEIDPTMNNPVYVVPSEEQRPRLVSQTLIQDVVILQMGTFTKVAVQEAPLSAPVTQPGDPTPTRQAVSPARASQQTAAEEPTQLPDVVTLIVSSQDAVTLNYLMLAGANLNMVLRSAGDNEIRNTEAVTLQFILDQYQIPNPAKLPYGLEPGLKTFPEFIKPFPEPAILATPTKANQ